MKHVTLMAMAMLTACPGCLIEDDAATDFAVAVPMFDDSDSPAAAAVQDFRPIDEAPAVAARPLPPVRHGFAIVYGNPANCTPCRALVSDLKWANETNNIGTLGVLGRGDYDWRFCLDAKPGHSTPFVEFYSADGALVHAWEGYSTGDWKQRAPLLRQIVDHHASLTDAN